MHWEVINNYSRSWIRNNSFLLNMGVLNDHPIRYWLFAGNVYRNFRTSHQMFSMKKAIPKISAIFKGKHMCRSLFLIMVIKKRLQHRCFHENIANFSGRPVLKINCKRLLLDLHSMRMSIILSLSQPKKQTFDIHHEILHPIYRSSHRRCSVKKVFLEIL